jgi:hypothetical protein
VCPPYGLSNGQLIEDSGGFGRVFATLLDERAIFARRPRYLCIACKMGLEIDRAYLEMRRTRGCRFVSNNSIRARGDVSGGTMYR